MPARRDLAIAFAAASAQALAQTTVPLRIIAFNDFHGHLAPGHNSIAVEDPADPSRTLTLRSGGAAYLATRIRQLRAEGAAQHRCFVGRSDRRLAARVRPVSR